MIVIESHGIGIGKTHLRGLLEKALPGSRSFCEEVAGAPLAPFYRDIEQNIKPSPAALHLQFYYMDSRYFQHRQAQEFEWKWRHESIFDRTIWGDYGFAFKLWKDGFLGDMDYKIYMAHRKTMEAQLLAPHAVIKLDAPSEFCIKRIQKRMKDEGYRVCETAVTVEYLDGLREAYAEVVWPWFKKNNVPVLEYEWTNGAWDSFPDVQKVLLDLKEVLPSTQKMVIPHRRKIVL